MRRSILFRFSIILGLLLVFLGTNIHSSRGQGKSTFELGKQKTQKKPIPGEGSLKGAIVVLGKSTKIPLAFIEVEGGKSVQADAKGKFELVLDQGSYKIKIDCAGYKDLTIENITIQEGIDVYIKIELSTDETGKFH